MGFSSESVGIKFPAKKRKLAPETRKSEILSEALPNTKAGKHVSTQILRSGTSPAPNYGEAQSAESKADFIHKLKVALKELRETEIWIKIITKTDMIKPVSQMVPLLQETDELIAILFKSIGTAKNSQSR